MAITTRALRTTASHRPTMPAHGVRAQLPAARRHVPGVRLPAPPPLRGAARGAARITVLLTLAALILVLPRLLLWAQTTRDDLHYGRPRTTMLHAFVGHHEVTGAPTQIVAMNLNRQVVVVEFPGGAPDQAHILRGPYLFGSTRIARPFTSD